MRKVIIISFLPYCYCGCWTHCCRCYCHHRCCGCCCSSRQQNTMALKDEPSPKCTFPGAGTSLLKSYKKLAVGAEITVSHFPLFKSRCHWPRPLLWLLPQLPAAKHHGCCSGCCCSSRQQNTMALKDEPSPKYTFPGAGTSLLKSYKKLAAATATAAALAAAAAPGSKTPWP